MEKLNIHVKIAGRSYPLTVEVAEEERVRKAADQVNETIQNLQQNYAVSDSQDVLAMAVLQFATQWLESSENSGPSQELITQLETLDQRLEACLKDQ